jgi:hypothetical protein
MRICFWISGHFIGNILDFTSSLDIGDLFIIISFAPEELSTILENSVPNNSTVEAKGKK